MCELCDKQISETMTKNEMLEKLGSDLKIPEGYTEEELDRDSYLRMFGE